MDARRIATLSLAAMLGACAGTQRPVLPPAPAPSPAPDVSYGAVAEPGARHYPLSDSEVAISPTTGSHNRAPAYPVALVPLALPPMQVRVTLVVDATGRVEDALFAAADVADPHRRAFDAAVRRAVLGWTFEPLRKITWEDTPDGGSRAADQPLPFSQTFVFRFELKDGHAMVSSMAPP